MVLQQAISHKRLPLAVRCVFMLLLRSLILISDQDGSPLKPLRSLIIISDQHGAPTAISHTAHIPPTRSTSTIPHIHTHTHTLYHDKKTSFTPNKLTRGAQNLLHHKHPPTFNPAGTARCEGTSGGVPTTAQGHWTTLHDHSPV